MTQHDALVKELEDLQSSYQREIRLRLAAEAEQEAEHALNITIVEKRIDEAEAADVRLRQLTEERDDARRLHQELMYQVGKKFPDETRHETAKRYLRQHENHCGQGALASARPSPSPTPEEPRS